MYPTLFSIGSNLSVSSFGFFVGVGIILGSFMVWRLRGIYDIDKEKTLDLLFWVFILSFLGSRVFFAILNWQLFHSVTDIFQIYKFPGFSFWGAFIFGLIGLIFFTKRYKLNFWLISDIFSVGAFASLIFGSLGCFLGGCQVGVESNLSFAINQAGLIGKRFPIQIFYSLFYFLASLYLWRSCLKFHFAGKVLSLSLILLGMINFSLEFLRGDQQTLWGLFTRNHLFSFLSLSFGIYLFYKQSKRKIVNDLLILRDLILDSERREITILKIRKYCYNLLVNWQLKIKSIRKKVARRLNVKANPNEF